MNSVVHFEMPYSDAQRVKKFYESAFGWQMKTLGPEMGNYVLAATTESDDNNRPKTPGAINGGFFPTGSGGVSQPMLVVAVDDIQAAMKKVTAAGGKIVSEPVDIPGIGKYVSFTDTEGNRTNMLQPLPRK